MDCDDGSKTALRTPNRDDVLVFGPGQTLQHVAWLGRGLVTHDEILWVIVCEMGTERASTGRGGTVRTRRGWDDISPRIRGGDLAP
jgi:hypothetical protein